jgi:hypothetical protein
MDSEDLCPATGRECRNPVCERGGCIKARARSASKGVAKPFTRIATSRKNDVEQARRAADAAAMAKFKTDLPAVLSEAIEALEQGDAALTCLHQSLGAKSSPLLEQLRGTKARVRDFLRAHAADTGPAIAEEAASDAVATK